MPILRCALVILTVALACASPAAAQTPECNEDTARTLAREIDAFMLDDPLLRFLCGPFTGPGSNAVAIETGPAPTCWPVQHWGVFTYRNGRWEKALQIWDYLDGPIEAVGGDLRVVTAEHLDPATEPRCGFAGGTVATLWHWDGTKFVAGEPVVVKPPEPRTGAIFNTPRGLGVQCWLGDSSSHVGITCFSVRTRPKLYIQRATMGANGRAKFCRDRTGRHGCNIGNSGEDPVPDYKYGDEVTVGRFRCRVLRSGVRCVVTKTGKGFVISRTRAARV